MPKWKHIYTKVGDDQPKNYNKSISYDDIYVGNFLSESRRNSVITKLSGINNTHYILLRLNFEFDVGICIVLNYLRINRYTFNSVSKNSETPSTINRHSILFWSLIRFLFVVYKQFIWTIKLRINKHILSKQILIKTNILRRRCYYLTIYWLLRICFA